MSYNVNNFLESIFRLYKIPISSQQHAIPLLLQEYLIVIFVNFIRCYSILKVNIVHTYRRIYLFIYFESETSGMKWLLKAKCNNFTKTFNKFQNLTSLLKFQVKNTTS